MKEIMEVLVVMYSPWQKSIDRPRIDVEFWRKDKVYKEYEDLSSKQFSRLCGVLGEYQSLATVEADNNSMIINYRIR